MNNPNPARISAAMWEFVEALEALEPADTEYSGSWGDWKPGYHADRNTLLRNPAWRNDYSIRLPADKLGPGQMGAANDWTFRSAQRGDFSNISKYGGRVAAAHAARDPRLSGWREVLIQADMDKPPEGFDFVTWTTRTPDATHAWHGHFSILRQRIEDRSTYQAMLSILRGETLAQWQATRGDDMLVIWQLPNGWVGCSNGPTRFGYATEADLKEAMTAFGVSTLRKIAPTQLGAYGTDVTGLGGGQLVLTDEQIIAIGLRIIDAVPTAQEVADAVADEEAARMKE